MKYSNSEKYVLLRSSIKLSGSAKRKERKIALEELETIRALANKRNNLVLQKMLREGYACVDQCRWEDLHNIAIDCIFEYLKIQAEETI